MLWARKLTYSVLSTSSCFFILHLLAATLFLPLLCSFLAASSGDSCCDENRNIYQIVRKEKWIEQFKLMEAYEHNTRTTTKLRLEVLASNISPKLYQPNMVLKKSLKFCRFRLHSCWDINVHVLVEGKVFYSDNYLIPSVGNFQVSFRPIKNSIRLIYKLHCWSIAKKTSEFCSTVNILENWDSMGGGQFKSLVDQFAVLSIWLSRELFGSHFPSRQFMISVDPQRLFALGITSDKGHDFQCHLIKTDRANLFRI